MRIYIHCKVLGAPVALGPGGSCHLPRVGEGSPLAWER